MVDPVSLTVASLQNDMRRMEVIANNAANALTPGFKREMAAVAGQLGAPLPGTNEALASVPHQTLLTDVSPGTPRKTGNPLDVALLGEGFLEVRTERGTAYTRLGALHLDDQGRLVTQAGYAVSGVSGDIVLTTPTPQIDREGRLSEKGNQLAQLKVVSFEGSGQLVNIGGGLLVPVAGATAHEVAHPRILQEHLESSNVDSAREMISLVQTVRHFEAGSRVLQAYDDLRDKAFRNLGQF